MHPVPRGRTKVRATLIRSASGKIFGMKNNQLIPLCDVAEVAPGCAVRAETGGCTYAVFNVEGKLYVTQDECTHGPGSLAEGYVLDDEVECPFHQGRFHIPSGQATCAPATDPLKTWKAEIIEGRVCINPAEPEDRSGAG
jgi:nitrite reductase/ring-hydroxylating ferredoxin subunit